MCLGSTFYYCNYQVEYKYFYKCTGIRMSKSINAVLLSALVLPGAGHFYLKKYIMSLVLSLPSLAAIYYIASMAMEKAMTIVEKVQRGEIPPDIVSITEQVTSPLSAADAQAQNIAIAVLVLAWIAGAIDSYRVGRMLDSAEKAKNHKT